GHALVEDGGQLGPGLEPVLVAAPAERPPGPAGPGQVLARRRVVGGPRGRAAGQHHLDPAQRGRDVEVHAVKPLDRLVVPVLVTYSAWFSAAAAASTLAPGLTLAASAASSASIRPSSAQPHS